jgi:ADP-ribose pyrophosphatase
MAPKPWQTLTSRVVYQNPWTTIREDLAELPDGKSTIYGVVQCPDAVGVLPFIDEDRVLMVRQYRYVFGENHRWEMPTGGVKPGETLQQAARRELREEAGYDPTRLELIHTYFTSKMIVHEIAHLFIGTQLVSAQDHPDETEFLEVACFPFDRVLQMVLDSEIRDSMTVIAVLLADRLRRLRK